MVLAQPVTFEWQDAKDVEHDEEAILSCEMAQWMTYPLAVLPPAAKWHGVLAANLAMGALLCAAHRRGWSEGWMAGVPSPGHDAYAAWMQRVMNQPDDSAP